MFNSNEARTFQLWAKARTLFFLLAGVILAVMLLVLTLAAQADSLNTLVAGGNYFVDTGQSLGDAASWDAALGDLDGDGDLDAIAANGVGLITDEPDRIWINDGEGFFSAASGLGDATSYAVALADLDGDEDLDVFVGTSGYNGGDTIWLNNGRGTFSDTGQLLGSGNTVAIALGDIDDDLDVDAITVDSWADGNRVWLNNGSGVFSETAQILGVGEESNDVALADLDSDTDLDLFIANGTWGSLGRNRVWFNNGSGIFEESKQALGNSDSAAVALADLDGDGDLDAFVANKAGSNGQGNRVWFNDGHGAFSDSMQALGSGSSNDVVLSDVDFDGDQDAVVANQSGPSRVWLNDGAGVFTLSQPLSPFDNQAVAVGNLDQDNIPDLFFANAGFCDFVCFGVPNEVWAGNVTVLYLPLVTSRRWPVPVRQDN